MRFLCLMHGYEMAITRMSQPLSERWSKCHFANVVLPEGSGDVIQPLEGEVLVTEPGGA